MKTTIGIKSLPLAVFSFAALCFFTSSSFALSTDQTSQEKFLVLPLAPKAGSTHAKVSEHYGVPFIEGRMAMTRDSSVQLDIGAAAKHIFLLGMTEDASTISCWADPTNQAVRYWIGDHLGEIRLNYADGTTQTFPLVLGESLWFGFPFYHYQEPFPTDAHLRKTFADALRLYPAQQVADGNYVAVIDPKPAPITSITIISTPDKAGAPIITGLSIEPLGTATVENAVEAPVGNFPPDFQKFIADKSLRLLGEDEKGTQRRLKEFSLALYSNDKAFSRSHVELQTPHDYSGPEVSFEGSLYAKILANAFTFNIQDISDKVDGQGMYHTSTKGAISWNGQGFGTFATNMQLYYGTSWCRDMGRSLQEITELGYTNDALRCADYCLKMSRLWVQNPAFKYHGQVLPPHWSRIANRPAQAPPFENDGHGLVSLFLYKLWQRLPDRDDWLRARWPDVKAAGDWIIWQFDHPEISGASDGLLQTTGECAGGHGSSIGHSVYGDYACMNALLGLAQMAESIGQTNSAAQWRERAEKMRQAMAGQYIINDPKYGPVCTLACAGWPTHPVVLAPLVFVADYDGFAPQDADPAWHLANEASYQRLLDTYQPFGFYGQAMGYGQGSVTEAALLLDRMNDATAMLNWIAKQIYDPRYGSFITPEGVQVVPSGEYWFRAGDLGNGVQEAEIVKTLRLVIGVDDTQPGRLQFYPRMPYNWDEIAVKKYPVLCEDSGKMEMTFLHYKLERSHHGMKLKISADKALGPVAMRLGPFGEQPDAADILVNGKNPAGASIERSGDSWWVKFTVPVGPGEEDED